MSESKKKTAGIATTAALVGALASLGAQKAMSAAQVTVTQSFSAGTSTLKDGNWQQQVQASMNKVKLRQHTLSCPAGKPPTFDGRPMDTAPKAALAFCASLSTLTATVEKAKAVLLNDGAVQTLIWER